MEFDAAPVAVDLVTDIAVLWPIDIDVDEEAFMKYETFKSEVTPVSLSFFPFTESDSLTDRPDRASYRFGQPNTMDAYLSITAFVFSHDNGPVQATVALRNRECCEAMFFSTMPIAAGTSGSPVVDELG
jgi:hypothetical protein